MFRFNEDKIVQLSEVIIHFLFSEKSLQRLVELLFTLRDYLR